MKHVGPLALFAALAVAWTWPLARHLTDAIPGSPGDNYSFVWNLWWMRHVLATPNLGYFHTTYLFYPFGTTIADHPHTAMPAIVAATLLRGVSPVTAQNLLLLAYTFLNMACAYALVWTAFTTVNAEHAEPAERNLFREFIEFRVVRRGAVLGALIFGLSPYLASHMLGHFDLVAAFVLPLFALCVHLAMASRSKAWSAAAGVVLAATAYTAYYYVVYLAFFLAVYLIAWLRWTPFRWSRRAPDRTARARWAFAALACLCFALALWIGLTGGGAIALGSHVVTAYTPQNALSGVWVCAILSLLCVWRLAPTREPFPAVRLRDAVTSGAWIAVVFLIGAAPLLWQAVRLVTRGEYVTPAYQWRSAPRGVDLLAPLLGPPLHPLTHAVERVYTAFHMDRIEAVGWIGLVPLILLMSGFARQVRLIRGVRLQADHGLAKGSSDETPDLHIWRVVAAAFGVWALGPILTIGGFDTGLKLPATLLRYVPFVANARMPGRAMVGVFMATAILAASALASLRGRWRSPAVQWLLIGLVAFEYWASPIPLTSINRPAVYATLAAAPPGAVCEVPFGIGDGLSAGVGSQERRSLYYATLHEHPLVGGYIGRMPADAAQRYANMPIVGTLLRLSGGDGSAPSTPASPAESPCRYLVVDRPALSAPLQAYVRGLPLKLLGSDPSFDLYEVVFPPAQ